MKYSVLICTLVLLAASSMSGQMAVSHESTTPAAIPEANKYFAASTPAVGALANKPVARVNGAVLTDRDLVREEFAIFPYANQHSGIPKGMEPQIRKGAMQM